KQSSKRKLATTKRRDSDIYFVKLPPAPYTYIEGLGYVSRGPSFTSGSLAFHRPHFVRPPVDFVSNGKPIGVYRWTAPDSPVVKLDRGPYLFNGKPRGDVFDGNNRPNDLLK
ncbi:uncharacterized protein LOC106646202, partial [Copidosoma floridanum]|uniref:uncharacterized protein LOC106646202 n=1 Tax=Copidosoma floridanum TaxID=29053 RepID=UPI0006C97712